MKYIPSQADCDAIKAAAARETGVGAGALLLEPGCRCGTASGVESSMNIALVSDDPDWGDTDLADYGKWAEFRKGVELTPEGRGIFDFYVSQRGDRDLLGNVVAYVEGGLLVRIEGVGPGGAPLWKRAAA